MSANISNLLASNNTVEAKYYASSILQDAGAEGSGLLFGFIDPFLMIIIGMFVLMYFLAIRPNSKKMKAHRELVSNIKPGDEVITAGGIYGRVHKVEDNFVLIQVSSSTTVQMNRNSISTVLPQGTISNL